MLCYAMLCDARHAFIVFETEAARNLMVRLYRKQLGEKHLPRWKRLLKCLWRLGCSCCMGGDDNVNFETHFKKSVPPGGRSVLDQAPEPSDVYWENLHLSQTYTSFFVALSYLLVIATLLASAACYTYVRFEQAALTERPPDLKIVSDDGVLARVGLDNALVVSLSLSVACVLILQVVNQILKGFIRFMVSREGWDTRTDFERSTFTKLSMALVTNSILMPLVVGCAQSLLANETAINQSWYEPSGAVYKGILVAATLPIEDALKMFPVMPLLNRYVLAQYTHSPRKLRELYMPPTMQIAQLYASVVCAVVIGMAYGTLYPPLYLLVALVLTSNFWATKGAIHRWYGRPPYINEEMTERLRESLSLCIPLHLLVRTLAKVASLDHSFEMSDGGWHWEDMYATIASDTNEFRLLVACLAMYVLYEVAPYEHVT